MEEQLNPSIFNSWESYSAILQQCVVFKKKRVVDILLCPFNVYKREKMMYLKTNSYRLKKVYSIFFCTASTLP